MRVRGTNAHEQRMIDLLGGILHSAGGLAQSIEKGPVRLLSDEPRFDCTDAFSFPVFRLRVLGGIPGVHIISRVAFWYICGGLSPPLLIFFPQVIHSF